MAHLQLVALTSALNLSYCLSHQIKLTSRDRMQMISSLLPRWRNPSALIRSPLALQGWTRSHHRRSPVAHAAASSAEQRMVKKKRRKKHPLIPQSLSPSRRLRSLSAGAHGSISCSSRFSGWRSSSVFPVFWSSADAAGIAMLLQPPGVEDEEPINNSSMVNSLGCTILPVKNMSSSFIRFIGRCVC